MKRLCLRVAAACTALVLSVGGAAQCFSQNFGTLVGYGDDGPLRPLVPIGFPFPFAGTTWTDVLIGNNGVLFLGNGTLPSAATETGYSTSPSLLVGNLRNGGPKIAAYWNDLVTDAAHGGGIYLDHSQAGRCVVTWYNTVEFLHVQQKTIQVQLFASGEIRLFYSPGFAVDRGLALCGVSPGGGAADPGPMDFSAGGSSGTSAYQLFDPGSLPFDLGGSTITLQPAAGGYAISSSPCDPAWHDPFGVGCGADRRSFYQRFDAAHPLDLAGKTIRGVENTRGGYDVSVGPLTTFVQPTGLGIGLGDDEVVSWGVGFPWDFPGGTTTVVFIDSNGRVSMWWGSVFFPVSDFTPSVEDLLDFPQGVLCVPHCDFVPDGVANVDNIYVETDHATEMRITWRNVRCFGSNVRSTFQVVLFHTPGPGGDGFELRFQSIVNDSTFDPTAIVGFSFGPGARDPGPRDLSSTLPFSTATDAFDDLKLAAAPAPVLGNSVVFTTSNLRSGLAANVLGFTAVQNGIELLPVAPRCYAYLVLGGNEVLTILGAGTVATNSIAIPALPQFVGVEYFAQSLQLASGINPANLITSNAVRGRIQAY